jgi:hypothetical protein
MVIFPFKERGRAWSAATQPILPGLNTSGEPQRGIEAIKSSFETRGGPSMARSVGKAAGGGVQWKGGRLGLVRELKG